MSRVSRSLAEEQHNILLSLCATPRTTRELVAQTGARRNTVLWRLHRLEALGLLRRVGSVSIRGGSSYVWLAVAQPTEDATDEVEATVL